VLTQTFAAAINLVASGSITGKDTVLFDKSPPKYTHGQIVGGLIFDITVSVILLSWLFYVSYRTYGPPTAWFRRRTAQPTT
jgi:hypothetical protein